MRTVLREVIWIVVAATAIGFIQTAVMSKGLFAPPIEASSNASSGSAPEFIALEDAVKLFSSGEALFVDARHGFDYRQGHIKGAINVPLKDFSPGMLGALPKDQLLITYCDGEECNSSIDMAKKLDSLGYSNVKIFFGGWKEWVKNNQPVEH